MERKKYEEQYAIWDSKTKAIRDEMSQIVEPLRKTKAEGGIKTFEDDVKEAILMDASKRDPWQQMMYHTASRASASMKSPMLERCARSKAMPAHATPNLKKAARGV